jgi:hypothetical protein
VAKAYSEPQYGELTPELREQLDKFREEHKDDPMGGVGSNILFEDDNVRIWDLVLAPGEASDLHHHEHDYYLVILSGDVVAGVPPKDSGMDPFIGVIPEGGNTVPVPKGGTEWAVNIGKETYSEILIELKNT